VKFFAYYVLVLSFSWYITAQHTDIIGETDRLYLRYFTADDAQALLPVLGDKDVMYYALEDVTSAVILQKFRPKSLEEIQDFLRRTFESYQKNGWGRYAIIKKDDDVLIGYCGLTLQKLGDGKEYIELGYRLAKKYWGHGYATEAACAVRDYARDVLQLMGLISILYPANTASSRVATKAGFVFWKTEDFYDVSVNVYNISF
jgi:[ribosomal protein S5]-alanine N-acetyltransferase